MQALPQRWHEQIGRFSSGKEGGTLRTRGKCRRAACDERDENEASNDVSRSVPTHCRHGVERRPGVVESDEQGVGDSVSDARRDYASAAASLRLSVRFSVWSAMCFPVFDFPL
ncbi:hypothetical protein OVY01_12380 [Robbsia sp. Bb-Pol-6]|uniref:Uncharacterized protein n=1 Tax=Robbsia betulipollinis TaxID=2981849 RepID=A0ABT3ZN99_9BURK|nr:hypothetical protein [Robbsia betulipollinis]MCY0388018.1 hypothetical protein [Robbsia betulipollinis]